MKGWGLPYEEWPQDMKDEYAYNPTAARKLLADAGYPNGFKTHIVADVAADMNLLQIVKSYFADIGIDMEIRPMASSDLQVFVTIERKHDQLFYRPYGPLGHTYAPSWRSPGSNREPHMNTWGLTTLFVTPSIPRPLLLQVKMS